MQKHFIIVPDDHYHKKNNLTFIVYDFESGKLIHESPNNKDLYCEDLIGQGRPIFRPFGIGSDNDYIYIASHKKLGKYNRKTFEYCGLVDIPMYINTHQILKSDSFYVAHTAVNAIGIHGKTDIFFDVSSFKCVEAPEHPIHAEKHDTIHINSVTEHNGKIYFCLHNLGKVPSQFGYFDKVTYESKIIASAGFCCHDVQILNEKLYALSSETGEIIEIDLKNGQTITHMIVESNKTFLRGMDVSDDKLFFCGSNRYTNGVIPMNNCFVASFDPSTKHVKRQFNINHADIVTCMKIV